MDLKFKVLVLVFVSECASSLLREGLQHDLQQREKRQIDVAERVEGERIEASGGGIVREGSNVTLSLYIGAVWDRCRWFRYDHAKAEAKNDFDTCSFDFDEDTNTSSLHKCDDPELKAMITPLQDDPYSCKIMLVNMSSDMEGKWAARLDTDISNKEIQLIMQHNVEDVELVVDEEVIAGGNVTIVCTAVGGKPDPVLTFMLMDGGNSTTNTTSDRFVDVTPIEKTDGETKVTYMATFMPQIADLGKSLCCKAVQIDMENNTLYETNKVLEKVLDVKFLPQPIQPDGVIELEAKLGETASLSLSIRSNPAPDTAVWSFIRTDNCGEDDIANTTAPTLPPCTFNVTPGYIDEKFIASEFTVVEDDIHLYLLDLQILNVDSLDYSTNYTATVTNSAGQQTYHFHLSENLPSTTIGSTESAEVTGENTSGSENEEVTESGGGPGLAVLMVILMLMGIIGGIVFYKKRQGTDVEHTPLTQTH